MTVVNPKSISGITSITTASGSDNLLTIHTSDASNTERFRIDSTGATKIVTGIVTTLTATTGIVTTLTANTVTSLGAISGTTGTFSGVIKIPDGSTSAPSIAASSDTNSGLYFAGADALGLVVGGSRKLLANSSGVTINNGDLTIDDKIIHQADTDTAIRFPAADTITAETGGSERFRIDSGGNVNFGAEKSVSLPSGTGIQVYHSANPRIRLVNDTTGNGSTDGTQIYLSSDGDTIIDNKDSEDIIIQTNASEKLRITSGGDLRLGLNSVANVTDSAHHIMTLTGKSGQTGAGAIAFRDPSANTDAFIFADGGNLFITADYSNATADSSIRFRVDGSSEKVRILSSGGITFNGDTAAANALDDYEEGTHTPTLINLDVPANVTTNHFNYTKIGRLVHINAKFTVSSSINDGSGFGFSLPFAQAGSRENVFTAISDRSGTNTAPFAFVVNANQSNAYAKELDGFGASQITYNSFSGDVILVTGTYEST